MKGFTVALALAAAEAVSGHTIFTQLNGNREYKYSLASPT